MPVCAIHVCGQVQRLVCCHALPTWQDEFRLVVLCVVLPTVIVLIVTQAVVYWRQLRRNRP